MQVLAPDGLETVLIDFVGTETTTPDMLGDFTYPDGEVSTAYSVEVPTTHDDAQRDKAAQEIKRYWGKE